MSSQRILEHPEEAIDGMTHGMYAQLKTWSDVMHRCGEYAGDNIMIRGASTDAFFEFISFNRTPQNYRLQDFWDNSYKAIIQASNIIELYGTSTDEEVKAHVGEAYFIRGFLYFYLVRAYGAPTIRTQRRTSVYLSSRVLQRTSSISSRSPTVLP